MTCPKVFAPWSPKDDASGVNPIPKLSATRRMAFFMGGIIAGFMQLSRILDVIVMFFTT